MAMTEATHAQPPTANGDDVAPDFRYPSHVLTSASLFPPPPPNYVHFTPLSLWFWSVLKEHIPSATTGQGPQNADVTQDADGEAASGPSTSSSSWKNPRLDLQRTTLLRHASAFDALPEDVRTFAEAELGIHDDDGLAQEIRSGRVASVDLRMEMDPPDLAVVVGSTPSETTGQGDAGEQPPLPLGGYHLFGEWWPVPAKMTGLEEAGVKRLYDEGGQVDAEGRVDRRPALLMLLRSLLTSYLKLLSLLQFPPSYWALRTLHTTTSSFSIDAEGQGTVDTQQQQQPSSTTHEEDQWLTTSASHWNHVRTLALNFQEALNRSRKEQTRRNLEGILAAQLARRREQTHAIREKVRSVRGMLDRLRSAADEVGRRGDGDFDSDEEGDLEVHQWHHGEVVQPAGEGDAKRIRGGTQGKASTSAAVPKSEAMDVN